jgi:hypothetical protein
MLADFVGLGEKKEMLGALERMAEKNGISAEWEDIPGQHVEMGVPALMKASLEGRMRKVIGMTPYAGCVEERKTRQMFAIRYVPGSKKGSKADAGLVLHRDAREKGWVISAIVSLSDFPSSVLVANTRNFHATASRQTTSLVVPDRSLYLFPGSHVTHGVPRSVGERSVVAGFFPVKRSFKLRVIQTLHQVEQVCVDCNVGFKSRRAKKDHDDRFHPKK